MHSTRLLRRDTQQNKYSLVVTNNQIK